MTFTVSVSGRTVVPTGWLHNPATYIVCTPLLSIVGAIATILAPMLLDPPSFAQFALLNSVYLYVGDFDLGLGRLSDRILPTADDPRAVISSLLATRYCIAALLFVATIITGFALANSWTIVAGFAGIAQMLSNGPYTFYRTRSHIAAFTVSSFMMQFALTLPRIGGLLLDGVRGCFIMMTTWCVITAVILNVPFIADVRRLSDKRPWRALPTALPLFVFSSAWLLYLLANRWFSWLISSPHDAGLYAFGANLVVIGVGFVSAGAQLYYPKHLAGQNASRLGHELMALLGLATTGCLIGNFLSAFALSYGFPHYAEAKACIAALLFSGMPLSLNAWLIPVVITRSKRPLHEGGIIFSVSLIGLYGLMRWLDSYSGIIGQAWACVPPTMLLLAMQLHLGSRARFLHRRTAIAIWMACLLAEGLCVVVWCLTFR